MTRRTERVNDLLREEISELIRHEMKDPRINSLITVTEVDTTPDLRYAKVFVSIMGTEEEKRNTLSRLAAATGFFRRSLAARLNIRRIPDLDFRRDDSIERGSRLLELIKQVERESGEKGPGD